MEEPADLAILIEGYKFLRKVMQTEPVKSLIKEEVFPGKAVDLNSDEQIAGEILPLVLFPLPALNQVHRLCQEESVVLVA